MIGTRRRHRRRGVRRPALKALALLRAIGVKPRSSRRRRGIVGSRKRRVHRRKVHRRRMHGRGILDDIKKVWTGKINPFLKESKALSLGTNYIPVVGPVVSQILRNDGYGKKTRSRRMRGRGMGVQF